MTAIQLHIHIRQGQTPGAAPLTIMPLGLRDTQTQTVRHMRCGGTGGSALLRPGARRASPPPCAGAQSTARGAGQSEAGGAAHPGGGGGGSAKRPKRHQQGSVPGGQASKRGRGHPDPSPPREAGASDAAGRGQAWARRDGGHITPPHQRF